MKVLPVIQYFCISLLANSQEVRLAKADMISNGLLNPLDDWQYPSAPSNPSVKDTFFGTDVQDPYRPIQSPFDDKTNEFINDQNKFTNRYLGLDNTRESTRAQLQRLLDYERFGLTQVVNGTTYQLYNPGTYSQSILTKKTGNGGRQTLVDPRQLFERDFTRISTFKASRDGKYLAYVINRKGSDWQSIYIINLRTGKRTEDEVLWAKFNGSIDWDSKSTGFYYYKHQQSAGLSFDKAGLENVKSINLGRWFYKVGTTKAKDTPVEEDRTQNAPGSIQKIHVVNDRYTIIISQKSIAADETHGSGSKATLIDNFTRSSSTEFALSGDGYNYIEFVSSDEDAMYFITDIGATNRHFVSVKFSDVAKFDVVVPEADQGLLYASVTGKDKKVSFYHWDGISFAKYVKNGESTPIDIEIPFGDANWPFLSKDGKTLTFSLTSFLYAYQKYEYNFDTKKLKLVDQANSNGFKGSDFVQYRAFYKGKDGQEIPILLAHKKGLKPDKSQGGLMYGYGGFNTQMNPSFRPHWAYLMKEKNFVLAIPLIRGGGERGNDWWQQAVKLNKPLSYQDFSAAADFLQNDSKYGFVGKKKLFINGSSNGGLLVAATCNLIPDQLGGCLADIGVHDLLRFQQFTVGAGWARDYGTSADSKEQFDVLRSISPLENVLPASNRTGSSVYPHYLISTADYDNRVSPLHSLKLAATIQAKHKKASNPALLYVARNSGHAPSNLPVSVDAYLNQIGLINISLAKLSFIPNNDN